VALVASAALPTPAVVLVDVVRRVVEVARGYRLARVASECNGVGASPSQELT
jgi:hypothetical protein